MHQLCVQDRRAGRPADRVVPERDELVVENRTRTQTSHADSHPVAAVDVERRLRALAASKPLDGLPSAPAQPIVYLRERNRPQPALDVDRGRGMTVTIGRLRPCPILDYKFIALGHNTIRGAAGVAILNAELMHRDGFL